MVESAAASGPEEWLRRDPESDLLELALSEWGDPAWADEVDRLRLLGSWVRRKRLEARFVAVELAGLWGGGQAQAQAADDRVSPAEMLGQFGVRLD